MEATNVKTWKLFTIYGSLHPKSKAQRLYTNWKEGGWGLVSVNAIVLDETQSVQEYNSKMALKDELQREFPSQ